MEKSLTWAEFVEKYQPKNGDEFLDDRGNVWVHAKLVKTFHSSDAVIGYASRNSGYILTCPLIPPKAKRKMWPMFIRNKDMVRVSDYVFETENEARNWVGDSFHSWPAIPGPDGSYEVPE